MSDLNWCQCGKQTTDEALYCSLGCMRSDIRKELVMTSQTGSMNESLLNESSSSSSLPVDDQKLYIQIDYSRGTFNIVSDTTTSTACTTLTTSNKRTRMDSIETPPTSPALGYIRTANASTIELLPAETTVFSTLAFHCRKKRV